MTNEEFEKLVLSKVEPGPFKPIALYDPQNDSLEILISDESYRRERIDEHLSVYNGRESEEITGAVIKGVKHFVDTAKDLDVMFGVRNGDFKVLHLFKAIRKQSKKKSVLALLISKLEAPEYSELLETTIPNLVTCQ
jgi:hypothetical protein